MHPVSLFSLPELFYLFLTIGSRGGTRQGGQGRQGDKGGKRKTEKICASSACLLKLLNLSISTITS